MFSGGPVEKRAVRLDRCMCVSMMGEVVGMRVQLLFDKDGMWIRVWLTASLDPYHGSVEHAIYIRHCSFQIFDRHLVKCIPLKIVRGHRRGEGGRIMFHLKWFVRGLYSTVKTKNNYSTLYRLVSGLTNRLFVICHKLS